MMMMIMILIELLLLLLMMMMKPTTTVVGTYQKEPITSNDAWQNDQFGYDVVLVNAKNNVIDVDQGRHEEEEEEEG